jgi:glutamate N-acetyltransferase/amino-acid N-acetyltransferase
MKKVDGGICAIEGVKAAGACEDNYGVAVIYYPHSQACAVYTSNQVKAAPLNVTRKALQNGKISAIVANSGNANCFTGPEGVQDAQDMALQVAKELDLDLDEVGVASTGIIGRKMPMDVISQLITDANRRLEHSPNTSRNAAEAIMTTDTFPKEYAVETTLHNGQKIRIGGICKGSGMIAPNMGTMLAFLTTDMPASLDELKKALKIAVDKSFNMVDVDGDISTNDIMILMAPPGKEKVDSNFQEALNHITVKLARMIARDGEGATKFMEVKVTGAESEEDAIKAAKAITSSSLVKTALFGADPNWGRIIAAVGYCGAKMDAGLISVSLSSEKDEVDIVDKGQVLAFEGSDELELAESIMEGHDIQITVKLGIGKDEATGFGCDLSYDYVRINSEYST